MSLDSLRSLPSTTLGVFDGTNFCADAQKFGGVCLKKLEPISSRTPDFARSACVVACNCIVRSDCVEMRTNAPRTRSRTRVCKTQKFSFLIPFPRRGAWGEPKKWKGNFCFCFAASVSEKSTIILSFLIALFSAFTATEAHPYPRLVVALYSANHTQPPSHSPFASSRWLLRHCACSLGGFERV